MRIEGRVKLPCEMWNGRIPFSSKWWRWVRVRRSLRVAGRCAVPVSRGYDDEFFEGAGIGLQELVELEKSLASVGIILYSKDVRQRIDVDSPTQLHRTPARLRLRRLCHDRVLHPNEGIR